MLRTMAGTLPWAVVLVAAGGGTWWLLSREIAGGRWLLAALLIGHGLVHLLFAVPAAASESGSGQWPFDIDRSWAITAGHLGTATVRLVATILIAITVGGFVLAGLASLGVAVPANWWAPLVTVAAIASMALLVVCFDPQLVLGMGIDAILLWIAATRAWMP